MRALFMWRTGLAQLGGCWHAHSAELQDASWAAAVGVVSASSDLGSLWDHHRSILFVCPCVFKNIPARREHRGEILPAAVGLPIALFFAVMSIRTSSVRRRVRLLIVILLAGFSIFATIMSLVESRFGR